MIRHKQLLEILCYDPNTGDFIWLRSTKKAVAGQRAGWLEGIGYRYISIDGRKYSQHRLAFFYMTKCWPANQVDHKNGIRADNRWSNLREATPSQNCINRKSTTRSKGAVKQPSGRWRAQIRVRGKKLHIGLFDTAREAHAAYMSKARELFGEFARAA